MTNRWMKGLAALMVSLSLSSCLSSKGTDEVVAETSTSTQTGVIPDTGQTNCFYDYTLDGFYNPSELTFCGGYEPGGQDGDYPSNPMSYTDNSDGTIRDNVTGLDWRKCSAGLSGTDCATGSLEAYDWNTALTACSTLGNGWRLPTITELTRIVDYGSSSSIDDAAFPNTGIGPYWSSTTNAADPSTAWYVYFGQENNWSHYKTELYYVRCVRG